MKMKKIIVNDTTIFSISKVGRRTAFKDRVEAARLLDAALVDAIELPEFSDDKTEEILIKSISTVAKHAAVAVRVPLLMPEYAEKACEAMKNAAKKRLQVAAPVSAAQMEFVCHQKPAKLIETIKETVSECRKYTEDVEFIAEDAFGGEFETLAAEISAAIEGGATFVTVCEASGVRLPDEIASLVAKIRAEIEGADKITLLVSVSNAFHLGLASAIAAVKAGADGVKTAVSDDTIGAVELSEIARQRANEVGFSVGLNVTVLGKTVNKINWMLGDESGEKMPVSITVESANAILAENDSIEKLGEEVAKLGYTLSHDDLAAVYEEFKRISRKRSVKSKELEAIIATTALQVPPVYKLISYVTNSGNVISSMADVKLEKNGKELEGVCVGDGPIDAAFKAIEQIIGHHYELDDFQIQSVTEGREAVGSAIVKLRSEGKLYSGQGISTDIIGASIRAYVNALNKIVYEE
jgi:2-isopropylmalate synthase